MTEVRYDLIYVEGVKGNRVYLTLPHLEGDSTGLERVRNSGGVRKCEVTLEGMTSGEMVEVMLVANRDSGTTSPAFLRTLLTTLRELNGEVVEERKKAYCSRG